MLGRVFLILGLLLKAPSVFGCAVCGFGDDGSREAFILTTGIMTFVPLIFIGCVLFYMRRRYLRLRRQSVVESE